MYAMRLWIFSLLLCCSCVAMEPTVSPRAIHSTEGFAPVAGGTIHYDVTGRGQTIVLLHGGGMDLHMWDVVLPRLAHANRVVRWDAPGHGKSTVPQQPTAETEDELLALLDHLQIERVNLVGFSMGAGTATGFAVRHPQRVERLVLISTSGPPPGVPPSTSNPPLTEAEGRQLLAASGVPVLMIVGSRDGERILSTASAVAREVPSAELITIEGGSHYVTSDRPQEVASAVLAFVTNRDP